MKHVLEIEVRQIELWETYVLRQKVLWPDRSVVHVMVDGDDAALHLGAYVGAQLAGVGSFYADADGVRVRLRKLAVLKAYQGRGLGGQIVASGAKMVAMQGAQFLWCDARETAIGFYERLGFVITPERFDKSGVVYVKAEKVLVYVKRGEQQRLY